MQIDVNRLKTFLLDSGLIGQPELDGLYQEAEKNNRTIDDVILASGKIPEDEYRKIKAYLLGIPFISLKKERVDHDVLFMVPEPVARRHNIVAYRKSLAGLEVAMLNPEDLEAIEFIKKSVNLKILPRLTDSESIRSILLQYQKSLKAEFGDIIQKEAGQVKSLADEKEAEVGEGELKKLAADVPIVRIVDTLLAHAVTQQASDIHIEPHEREVVIRYRIDGVLHDAMILPRNIASGITARIKILSNLRLDEKRLPQDGRFKIELNSEKISFRVSILPTYYGEKIVMRLLPDAVSGFTLEKGGFHGYGLERLHTAIRQKTGLILVTGPTGSGKSTTLYTLVDILNTPDVNISTIEDPVEYRLPRINQTQVKPDIGLTFAAGLRSLMRQDPNIIMVGEIRDQETANLAINAALTGHLVLSTLHTNSAAATVPRLLDMGAEAFLLVSTIKVIISQRLVRRLAGTKQSYHLTAAELKNLEKQADLALILKALKEEKIVPPDADWPNLNFYHPTPSEENPEGYAGRIGIHEILALSPAIAELIMKNATHATIEGQAKKEGMMTMLEDGIYKAASGVTTVEEVFRVISE